MIQWLHNRYDLYSGDKEEREELDNLRTEVQVLENKYNLKKGIESDISTVEEIRIEELHQKQIEERKTHRPNNVKKEYSPKVIPKTEEQINLIKEKCIQNYLFNSLGDKELKTVIDSFEEKKFSSGQNVITQGEEGDALYLVDNGELDCEKINNKGEEPIYLKTYKTGDSFGELALLYNVQRAATIKANTDVLCWRLDKECFNNVIRDAAIQRRVLYENILKKVEILQNLDPYELGPICDAIKTQNFMKGDFIIKQGEIGDTFYILDEGNAHAERYFESSNTTKKVKDYESGGYFGELALINDESRAASIIADTDCKCLSLDKIAFQKFLEPLVDIFLEKSKDYITE